MVLDPAIAPQYEFMQSFRNIFSERDVILILYRKIPITIRGSKHRVLRLNAWNLKTQWSSYDLILFIKWEKHPQNVNPWIGLYNDTIGNLVYG